MPYLFLTVLVIILDQASKFIVQTKMFTMQSIQVIRGWFSLTFVTNYGGAFGILQSQTLLLIGVSIGVIAILLANRKKISNFPHILQIGLAIAFGGAIGNLIDRIRLGYVVDFFDFYVWPVFNIADMAIVSGVGLIILGMFWKDLAVKFQRSRVTDGAVCSLDRPASGEEKQ